MKWAVLLLLLTSAVVSPSAKKAPRIPVMISIRRTDGNTVYFQPMIAPLFYGVLHGKSKEKIGKCYASQEPVAELKDGGEVTNLVLECGESKIIVQGVDFE
jgi:hypothetical protein